MTINKTKIDSIDISTVNTVRNLGAIFESALSSEAFENSICKSAWFNLFNISRGSRRSLTTDSAKGLIQAFVMSNIDYCNSLLYGIPGKYSIVFSEFRTMLLGWSSVCINSAIAHQHCLATLYQLPVNRRIDFKIALLVSKALNGQASADLLQPYDLPQKLRSTDKQLRSQPPCRLKSYGDHAFCCAPQLYGTISLTVSRLPRLLIVLRWN